MTATNPLVTHDWKGQVDAFTAQIAEELGPERSCRICGCTEDDCSGCVRRTGRPCYWIEADLCSACRYTCPTCKGTRGVFAWDTRIWSPCTDCLGTGRIEEGFAADHHGLSRERWVAFNQAAQGYWERFDETYPRP